MKRFIAFLLLVLLLGCGCSSVRLVEKTRESAYGYDDASQHSPPSTQYFSRPLQAISWFLETFEKHGGRELIDRIANGDAIETEEDYEELGRQFPELDSIFGIRCLVTGLRPNMDALESPPNRAYRPVRVCVEQDEENFPECSQDETIQFVDKLDASGSEFRYQSEGPEAMQGVFWFDYDGDGGGSLVSYAKSRDEGTLSMGYLESQNDDISFRVRAGGDRVFSFTGNNIEFKYIQLIDVVYETRVIEGTDDDPKKCQLFYTVRIPFASCWRYHFRECFNWMYYFDMTLVENEEEKGERKDSVIWRRDSTILTWSGSYPMTQIINGQGQPIEPAYSEWVAGQKQRLRIGDEKNKNVFFSLDDYDGQSTKARSCWEAVAPHHSVQNIDY